MKRLHYAIPMTALAFTAGALAVVSSPLLADEANRKMEEIVVQAPVKVERKELRSVVDPIFKTELIELKRNVYIGDLDLSKHSDVQELENRIEQIARDSCDKLSEMFPLSGSRKEDRMCVQQAIESAGPEIEKALAAAQ